MMKSFDKWRLLQRVLFTNAIAVAGILLGFAISDVTPTACARVYIVVLVVTFLNLMLVVVRPRLAAQRASGATALNPFRTLYQILKERPLITVLCICQLLAACRATATTIQIVQTMGSDYVRGLHNAQSALLRLELASVLTAADSTLWFLSAIGLWRTRSWAWWVALVLNSLAAIISVVVQVAAPNKFLVDPIAIVAAVLLLIQPVRKRFRENISLRSEEVAVKP